MPESPILAEWFAKIDGDIAFLIQCFAEVLEELGDGQLASALPWRQSAPAPVKTTNHRSLQRPNEAGVDRELQVLSIAYHLLNLVEENAAAQARRQRENNFGLLHEPGLWGHSLAQLGSRGLDEQQIAARLHDIHVEVVLTAHPTEAKRPPVLRQHRELFEEFTLLESNIWTQYERENVRRRIKVVLERLWRTGEMYLVKPEVLSELDHVLDYFRNVFPAAVSILGDRFEDAWTAAGFDPCTLTDASARPRITFGNWVGGDRDGHPLVTSEVTAETLRRLRRSAIETLATRLQELTDSLTLSDLFQAPPPAFIAALDQLQGNERKFPHEPWREFAHALRGRLKGAEIGKSGSYSQPEELEKDLAVLRQALVDVGAERLARAEIDPLLTHLRCFGFHTAALDIRQNSVYYAKAIEQLLDAAGLDDWRYTAWDATKRRAFLQSELQTLRPLAPRFGQVGEEANAVLRCFQVVADHLRRYGPRGIGSFIVSITTDASDLICVYLFAREVGLLRRENDELRSDIAIVPLFETLEDLEKSARILREFLAHPITQSSRPWTDNENVRQQVMVGYSDSNKGAGIFASHWALHRAQSVLAAVGREFGRDVTFFHGRGGTFSRGAGPTHRFLESLPPGSLTGHIRLTEQGEMIAQKFGNLSTAVFNLELLLAGVVVTTLKKDEPHDEDPHFDDLCERMSRYSSQAYRELIGGDGFLEFWANATPIDALERSFIGSRPARRSGQRNLDDLRAIPWVFGWTQARYYLPGWYGMGAALEQLRDTEPNRFRELQQRISQWPFLRYVLYNVETSLASADLDLMREYAQLVPGENLREHYFDLIAQEYRRTESMIDYIFGESRANRRPRLHKTLEMRAEGLRRLHRRQIQLLREWRALRASDDESKADALFPSLLLSINAIASAQRTTG